MTRARDGQMMQMMRTAMSSVVGALAAATVFLLATPSLAQDCTAADADILRTARRARTIVADYNEMHRIHRADLARNDAFARETGQDLPWRFDLVGIVGWRSTGGFEVCSNQGPWQASVGPMTAGGLFSVDVYEWGVGIEAFALLVDEVLRAAPTEEQTRTADGGHKEPTGLANVQAAEVIYGGRLTLHRWASLVVGLIESGGLQTNRGDDGRLLLVPNDELEPHRRLYVGAGSPFGDTSFHIIFEPEDVASDIIELRADALPLPIDFDAVGLVGASYIEDETQVALELGVAEAFDLLTLIAATEFNPVRLRTVRGRIDWDGGPQTILRATNPETGEENAMRLALDLGVFTEVSYFNSRHLEDETDRDHVWGVGFGATARPDATILMGQLDLWFGVNRPDELARISQFVDHWQLGVRMHGRFGL